MISQGGKKIIEKFVVTAKSLLTANVTEQLQHFYGIWTDGHYCTLEQLSDQSTDVLHTARMLRERLQHLIDALPEGTNDPEKKAVGQLVAEQAFTQLNRFCAIRMCEERELIFESIRNGYDSTGFQAYDAVASKISAPRFERYLWYLHSVFDELSMELPAVFDRFSPYGLIFPDEATMMRLIELINDKQLSAWYDELNGTSVNFWKEDETLGWIFQYYNSHEERRKMRDESTKPRNSREMAVRNQFFTPEYVVRFLTDNSLGRIWYEMTGGSSAIGEEQCKYMIRRPNEEIQERKLKEPTEILSLDPTCGSMHFGLYLFDVYEYIYMDAWDNQPSLLHEYRAVYTRETFRQLVPKLILENNIFGCEIDPRALQIAALSLWLRAQKSFSEAGVDVAERPLIKKSNLVLAETMPGNKHMLKALMEELDKPMQRLLNKIWDKMKFAGELGLLLKMEKEIEEDIDYLSKNWSKVNSSKNPTLFSSEEEKAKIEAENERNKELRENKDDFFSKVTDRLKEALQQLSKRLTEEEDYENALFSEDTTRGFSFIQLCQKRFDCIVMNPPFGEGSENTIKYLNNTYPSWCKNLVCAFFDRMQEMLTEEGRLGTIFDRTVMIKSSYEDFRRRNLCGYIYACADTGWNVLDANVETSTLVLKKYSSDIKGIFFDIRDSEPTTKSKDIISNLNKLHNNDLNKKTYIKKSINFIYLPNAIIGYYIDSSIMKIFEGPNICDRGFRARESIHISAAVHSRLYYEVITKQYIHSYQGSYFTLFLKGNRDLVSWYKNGDIVKSHHSYRTGDEKYLGSYVVGYGKRGDILDAQIVNKYTHYLTGEGQGIAYLSKKEAFVVLSFLNSIVSQYIINLYTAQHKISGNVNLLPMPEYENEYDNIYKTTDKIITIKRKWISLDETTLEYKGFIHYLNLESSVNASLMKIQDSLSFDSKLYSYLVNFNDKTWMNLCNIKSNSDLYKTFIDYTLKRPYEELINIDGATTNNIINKKVFAQEILMELVGMVFGRWDTDYAKGIKQVPKFGDVFDELPFMPVVSRDENSSEPAFDIPEDGILNNDEDSNLCLAERVREVMHYLWEERADDLEYELCQLIGYGSLQEYFKKPTGFFDYHFKRYTKSRRKAPIYWPVSSEDGSITYWIYYPKLDKNTLPKIILKLKRESEKLRSAITDAINVHDRQRADELRAKQQQTDMMQDEMTRIVDARYIPNHDDGVPVTAAPLHNLINHTGFRKDAEENMQKLSEGEYDWSHLAFSMYTVRVTEKAKKDWCLALTHGLEEICDNKPREKKTRKKKTPEEPTLDL